MKTTKTQSGSSLQPLVRLRGKCSNPITQYIRPYAVQERIEHAEAQKRKHKTTAFCERPRTCGGCHWYQGYIAGLTDLISGKWPVATQIPNASDRDDHAHQPGCSQLQASRGKKQPNVPDQLSGDSNQKPK